MLSIFFFFIFPGQDNIIAKCTHFFFVDPMHWEGYKTPPVLELSPGLADFPKTAVNLQ
jgi:hypothetical protein